MDYQEKRIEKLIRGSEIRLDELKKEILTRSQYTFCLWEDANDCLTKSIQAWLRWSMKNSLNNAFYLRNCTDALDNSMEKLENQF